MRRDRDGLAFEAAAKLTACARVCTSGAEVAAKLSSCSRVCTSVADVAAKLSACVCTSSAAAAAHISGTAGLTSFPEQRELGFLGNVSIWSLG